MAALVFAAKRASAIKDTQAGYLWKQFAIQKIRLREPPELDFAPETPHTLTNLVSLHVHEMGYSLADLAKMLIMNDTEVARTYSLDLPGQEKGRAAHLRVVHAIYLWLLPEQLYLPPTYHSGHFDFPRKRNEIVQLVGDADGALPIPQDIRFSRLMADKDRSFPYRLRITSHGVYVFVRDGSVRCGGVELSHRDNVGLWAIDSIDIEVLEDDSHVMIVETIMIDGSNIKKWELIHADH